MQFDQLGLLQSLLSAVSAKGYTEPTPIQKKAIPAILQGRDVLGGAQTGTGKTAAFALPVLQLLSQTTNRDRRPRALVLAPTRELAAQVHDSFATYGKNLSLKSAVIFGGVNINPQKDQLHRGVDVLVACPGRLLDHAGQRTVDLSRVEILVLDEADRMLDMGFIHDIRRVMRLLPPNRQNLLFSATYSNEIRKLADSVLNDPDIIKIDRRNTAAETVKHVIYPVPQRQKRSALSHLIKEGQWTRTLVFARTKHGANRLAGQLIRDGINAAAIHGNKSQAARTRALADFKLGKTKVLVATDIASRGLDIDQLPHVVNYELPNVPEDYIHRIGRTGRAGAVGEAVSLVSQDEQKLLFGIERVLGSKIASREIAGFEPDYSLDTPVESSAHRGTGRPQGPGGNARRNFGSQRPRRGRRGSGYSQRDAV